VFPGWGAEFGSRRGEGGDRLLAFQHSLNMPSEEKKNGFFVISASLFETGESDFSMSPRKDGGRKERKTDDNADLDSGVGPEKKG